MSSPHRPLAQQEVKGTPPQQCLGGRDLRSCNHWPRLPNQIQSTSSVVFQRIYSVLSQIPCVFSAKNKAENNVDQVPVQMMHIGHWRKCINKELTL